MKTIFENWFRFLNENEEKDKRFHCNLKDFKKGIQDWDENKGKNYIDIAKAELDMWLSPPINNKSSKYDPRGVTLCSVAKYWSAIYSPLAFAKKVLSKKQGGTGEYYSVGGNKNPAWSAAFIQYCMRASNDTSWERIQGNGQHLSGYGIGNHAWYWAGAYHNTLLLQNPDSEVRSQVKDDDWIYLPVKKLHGTFMRPAKDTYRIYRGKDKRTGKGKYTKHKTIDSAKSYLGRGEDKKPLSWINFVTSDIGYSKVRGDIILIVASSTRKKGIKTGRFHGDFIADGGERIGGNVSHAGGRVGSSESEVCAILTKDPKVKREIINFLGFNKAEEPEEKAPEEEIEVPDYDETTDDARLHPKIPIKGAGEQEQYAYDTMNKYYR